MRPTNEKGGHEARPTVFTVDCQLWTVDFRINPGNDRLSHKVPLAVPWALEGLTTVFGMGTGVSPPVWSPENC